MSPRTHCPGLSTAAATMMTMSRAGDLDLNHVPAPAAAALWDSMKDGLRQAMLQHEIIFKNQVRELHRLYWTQKSLMSEACWKRSASVSAAKSRCGSAEANNGGGVIMGMPSEFRLNRHRDFDLEAPVIGFDSELVREVTDGMLVVKAAGDQSDTAGVGREGGNCDDGDTDRIVSYANGRFIIDLEAPAEMEFDEETSGISSAGQKSLQDGHDNVNDLRLNGFSGFTLASRFQNHSANQLSEEHYRADHQREYWIKKSSVHADFGPSGISISGSVQSDNPPTQKCQPAPKCLHIDLNIAQDGLNADVYPETKQKFSSLLRSSSFVINGDQYTKSSSKCPNYVQPSSEYQTQTNSLLPDLVSCGSEKWMHDRLKDGRNSIKQSSGLCSAVIETAWSHEKSVLDMEVRSGTESPVEFCRNSTERNSNSSNGGTQNSTNGTAITFIGLQKHKVENVVSSMGQQQVTMHIVSRSGTSNVTHSIEADENYTHPSTGSTNLIPSADGQSGRKPTPDERNEEDTVSSRVISSCERQGHENEKSYDCNKFDQLSRSTEFTLKNNSIEEPRTTAVPDNSRTEVETLKHEGLCSNVPSFDIYASNPEASEQQRALVSEIDLMIVKAAETLLSISLENSASPYTSNSDGPTEFVKDEAKIQPQFTSDSFEEMTLKLEEIKDDGSSVTSKQFEKQSGKESCGIKLRRGRGLRDFQKDILPGLVSLSRHEICEDIHTIKHELRKIRSHITCNESLLTPARSRRSRIYNACRRS